MSNVYGYMNNTTPSDNHDRYIKNTVADPTVPFPQTNPSSPSVEWGEPLPLSSDARPAFPVGRLPQPLQDYVKAVAESRQVAVDMPAVSAIAMIALCTQRRWQIQGSPDWHEPLNLMVTFVAGPGERKSAIIKDFRFPVEEYEAAKNRRLSPDEKPIRLWTDDTTAEALASLMCEQGGKIGLLSAEGGVFDTLAGRYGNTPNIDVFLKGHAGDSLRVDRRGRNSEYIDGPALTTLLAIQPSVLGQNMTNPYFSTRGLNARLLYSIPESTIGTRNPDAPSVPESIKQQYSDLVHELLDIPCPETAETLCLSEEARQLSRAFAVETEPRLAGDLEYIGDWASKLHGAILRIAGNLHVVQYRSQASDVEVSGLTMANAIAIGRYFLAHAQIAFSGSLYDNATAFAKHLLNKIRHNGITLITKNDLLHDHGRVVRFQTHYDAALALLEAHGYIKVIEIDRPGPGRKPSPKILVNPALFG